MENVSQSNRKDFKKKVLEHGEELNLRMLQPLDTDTTAGILRESGYLVPLSKWSKARQDYKGNTDRWAFKIC